MRKSRVSNSSKSIAFAALVASLGLHASCAASEREKSRAEGFTGHDFLTWERTNQDSYIETSVSMTAIVATQGRQDIATCIDKWYSIEPEIRQDRHDNILRILRENPAFHPQGIILAVLQKQCGSFKNVPD